MSAVQRPSSHWRRVLPITVRVIVAVGALSIAIAAAIYLVETKPVAEVNPDPDANLPRVTVYSPKQVPVPRQWRGFGTVQAVLAADVPARVTATVEAIPEGIDAGVFVDANTELVSLDATDFNNAETAARNSLGVIAAQLDQLGAEEKRLTYRISIENDDLAEAEKDLNRIEELAERGAASQQDLTRARRDVLAARRGLNQLQDAEDRIPSRLAELEARQSASKADLAQAAENAKRAIIRAPFAGVLQSLDVEEGESVAAGSRVARIVRIDRVEVPVQLPAQARGQITVGSPVTLEPAVGEDVTFDATISRIAPEIDPETRTLTAYAELAQPAATQPAGDRPRLYPGTFVTAVVESNDSEPRWVLPRQAVQEQRLLAVRDGVVQSQPVQIAYLYAGKLPVPELPAQTEWVVLRGPAPADAQVIVTGSIKVVDGMRVIPVQKEPPPKESLDPNAQSFYEAPRLDAPSRDTARQVAALHHHGAAP